MKQLTTILLLGLLVAPVAQANTLTVTSTADSGVGSLRAALASAANGDTIDATGVSGTILLTSGELLVRQSVSILGPGPANLAVDGNAVSQVFHIGSNTVVSISGLTITNGFATGVTLAEISGGGIHNDHGALTLNDCTVTHNTVNYGGGGGIYNDGSGFSSRAALTIVNSSVSSNSTLYGTFPYGGGGGIYNERSTLTISNCAFSGNSAHDSGGGINNYNDATLTIVNTTLNDNAALSGGGIENLSAYTVTIANSTLRGNSAFGSGGGIDNYYATLTVSNCTVSYNVADNGGGIDNRNAVLQVVNSTVSSNSASEGGGIHNYGVFGLSATAGIVNSTLSGNSAGGTMGGGGAFNDATFGSATLTIANSTLSSNSATNGSGGAIFNAAGFPGTSDNALLTIASCTLSGNAAVAGGGIFNGGFSFNATVQIGSTILQAGSSGHSLDNSSGPIVSLGYNLTSDNGRGFLTNATDLINTDPMLGPLQDNGGPTFTHALLCGSPAIDKGTNFTGSPTDQRGVGFERMFDDSSVPNASGGAGTDIGAFELEQSCDRPPVARCKTVTVPANATCTASASIDDGSYDPDGNPITTSQSPPGPYPLGTNLVTLTVTDSHGASNSCSALVIVQDTTAPRIACPTNLTVEFSSPDGAPVSFAPAGSDDCSGPPSVTCVPASGSTFSIGTTTVVCTATDAAGNSAGCGFWVTVLGARGVKQNVLAELTALQASLPASRGEERQRMKRAIGYLAASLEPRFWVDETHVQAVGGGLAITEEARAVDELQAVMHWRHSLAPDAVLQPLILRVVKSDRLLATVSIQDATAEGVDAQRIRRAQAEATKGDSDASASRYAEAIGHYGDAWQEVQHTQPGHRERAGSGDKAAGHGS
jgi:hypothetical protein